MKYVLTFRFNKKSIGKTEIEARDRKDLERKLQDPKYERYKNWTIKEANVPRRN